MVGKYLNQRLPYILYSSIMNSGFRESTLYVILGSDITSVVDVIENPNIDKALGYEKQSTVK
jgi:hypothetical protein